MDLKKTVESLLFSSGSYLDVKEMMRLCKTRDEAAVRTALQGLSEEYAKTESSLMIINDGERWKLTVHEKYLPFVRRIVTQTELPKSVVETLAFVAFKAPILQSEVVRVRSNKAYDHLALLEEFGYLSRSRQGRSKLIKLTPKFFEYFDVDPRVLKQRFRKVDEMEELVAMKEREVREQEGDVKKRNEEMAHAEEARKKSIEAEHEKLNEELRSTTVPMDVFETPVTQKEIAHEQVPLEEVREEMGHLEVFDVAPEEKRAVVIPKIKRKTSDDVAEELAEEALGESVSEEGRMLEEESGKEEKENVRDNDVDENVSSEESVENVSVEQDEEVAAEIEEPPTESERKPDDFFEQKDASAIDEELRTAAESRESRVGEGLFAKGMPNTVAKTVDEKMNEMLHEEKPVEASSNKDMQEESDDVSENTDDEVSNGEKTDKKVSVSNDENDTGYSDDELNSFDEELVVSEDKKSQKEKGRYSPYKTGGPKRSRK